MAFQKNMGTAFRIFYLVLGAVLIAAPFLAAIEGSLRIALPVMGIMAMAAGGIGF